MSVIVDKVVEKAVDAAVDGLLEQIGYFLGYDNNIDCLREKLQDLNEAKEKVEQKVEYARRRLQDIYSDVLTWMSRAENAIGVARKILEEDAKADKTCCCPGSRLPNFTNCYMSSKSAKLEVGGIAKLVEKSEKIDKVGYPAPLQQNLHNDDYKTFESRESTLNTIMEALRNKEAGLIGIWGLGGVGKTTLAKEVGQRVKEEGVFKLVIMAEVHPKVDVKTIQKSVAEWLGIKKKLESLDSIELRAALLHNRLLQEKSALLILDDVWDAIDLKTVGIPTGGDTNRCTILVTTRDKAVISQMVMKEKKSFQIDVLRDDEAWELFQKTSGLILKDNIVLHGVATQIVERCGGLPILILPVATVLKDNPLLVWEDSLQLLKSGLQKNGDGTQALAYSALDLSYNHLSTDQRSLFLFCGLFKPHNIDIGYVVKYAAGLSLFTDCSTVKATRNRVLKLVGDLTSSCLLLKGDYLDHFTMHDVVHRFARGYLDHVLSPVDFSKVKEWPDMDALGQLTHISLRYCQLPDLPTILKCPKLKLFLLYGPQSTPSDEFFDVVEELKVLDLSDVHLSPLPSSLQRLKNLQTLCLDRCNVEDVVVIGNMTQLKILSLLDAHIVHLPEEIGKLADLQLLDLKRCRKLTRISPGILSCLTQLEELYMADSFTQWGLRDESDGQQINADLTELKELKKLTAVEIGITDVTSLPDDLFSDKLERFFIVIGDCWDWSRDDDLSATLKVKLDARIRVLEKVNVLLKKADDLHLDNSVGVKDVDIPELNMEGFGNCLINLQLQNFHGVQYLVNSVKRGHRIAFPRLEALVIDNAQHLEKICNGPLKEESLGNLKQIKISGCDALSNVFPLSVARCLSKLENIEVTYCEKIEGIFIMDEAGVEDGKTCLPSLRKLRLERLPKWRGPSIMIQEDGSPLSMTLFNEKVLFPNIEDLNICSIKINKIWDIAFPGSCSSIKNINTLKINGCKFIKSIFTISMLNSLAQLKRLEIRDCQRLEEVIIQIRLEKDGETNKLYLPKLESLTLQQLDSLVTVCTGDLIECPKLKYLRLDGCPQLKTFITLSSHQRRGESLFDKKVLFPSLEELAIANMDSLRMIWDEELHEDSFTKLKILSVKRAGSLLKLFSSNRLRRVLTLETLWLEECDLLEEVFDLHDVISERGEYPQRISMIANITAWNLPNLKHVWYGDSHKIFSFQNLRLMNFRTCSSLKSLIPASVSQQLVRLEEIKLNGCSSLEQIVYQQKDVDATVLFPRLKRIQLWNAPWLSSFFPYQHIIDWPALQHASIIRCPRLEVFKSKLDNASQVPKEPVLFSFEQVVTKLESVSLSNKEFQIIQKLELPDVVSSTIKDVQFYGFRGKSAKLPINFLERFQHLEKLEVSLSDFVELFTEEILEEEKESMALSRIQHLDLQSLDMMKHIWSPQSKLDRILNNLRSLQVYLCKRLIHLAPPSACFCNLTTLDVGRCKSLVSLFTFSTMTSLVQLREMTVSNCDKLTEILAVSDEKVEEEAEISVYKLQILKLSNLKSIMSFCSKSTLTLKFPLLVQLTMDDCPRMEFFSRGYLSAPKMKTLLLKDSSRWKGDLNTTICQLYSERRLAVEEANTVETRRRRKARRRRRALESPKDFESSQT